MNGIGARPVGGRPRVALAPAWVDRGMAWPKIDFTKYTKNMPKPFQYALHKTAFRPAKGEVGRKLVRSVLDVVALEDALDVFEETVQAANQSDRLLDLLALRGERDKVVIERRSGPSWSTDEVGQALKRSSETVRAQIAADKLVGYHALGDRTRLRLPAWQFQPGGAPHPWVPALIAAFGANGWSLLDFVTAPRTDLGQSDYLHLLSNGRTEQVLAAARRSNPD